MQETTNAQEIVIRSRKEIQIDGVNSVRAFDENGVILDTRGGKVVVEGGELKIENLDKSTGKILVVGRIDGVFYPNFKEKKKGRGLFR